MTGVVIVGAGQGGLQAAASLRQNGFEGAIALIGDEPGLPYQRPPLSKAYMFDGDDEALALRPDSFFAAKAIDYRPGLRVEAIDRAQRQVVTAGGALAYDHLILATGARNLRPPLPGIERTIDLRTLGDARRLRARCAAPRRFAVIGGGFIGLEFAAVARRLGHAVVLAEAGPRLMARAVSPQMSDDFAALHRQLGVDLRLGDPVAAVTDEGMVLTSGAVVEADDVLLAAGVRPNAELAEAAGLAAANGVWVNAQLLTDDPAISALGDCAAFPDARSGRRVRLESVQAATDHARHIAARLTGRGPADYDAVPWFWSDQADWKLQIAGLAMPEDRAERAGPQVVFRRDEADRVTAVETVNGARVHMKARKMMAAGPIPAGQAAELLA